MRPRITKKEAQFILDCLLSKKEEIEEIQQRYEDLKLEVWRLKQVRKYNTYEAIDKGKLPEKREKLERLEAYRYRFHMNLLVLDSLIAKYSRIAKGTKGKGRYKYSENRYKTYI